jgi:hypothetical protein
VGAGTLYDPVEKEVVIGAVCTLMDNESKETFKVKTDNFGDFWFRGLKDDRTFSLRLEKDGKSASIDFIRTDDDRNLGGFPGWSKVWQMLHPEGGDFDHQLIDSEAHENFPKNKSIFQRIFSLFIKKR